MYYIGKQHTLLLDNKTVEINGVTYQAFSIVEVSVNRQDFLELAARDRDKALAMGQRHKVTVRYADSNFEEHTVVKKFTLPHSWDMVLISLPALVGGASESDWLELFVPPTAALAPIEEPAETVEDDLGVEFTF